MQPSVSFALIVRNEEAKLPACLESIASIAGEIIVVDTGSTDRTKQVAAGFGAKVFEFPWIDDFAAARNECIRHAAGEWIFWLDADERVDEENREKLRRLFESLPKLTTEDAEYTEKKIIHESTRIDTKETPDHTAITTTGGTPVPLTTYHSPLTTPPLTTPPLTTHQNVAYVMKCLCGDGGAGGTVVDHVRLFRNRPEHRWKYRVHEQILPALKATGTQMRWTDIVIHHVGYQDPALTRHKLERNLRLLHLDIAEHPDDPYILFHLGWANLELGTSFPLAPGGRGDGGEGGGPAVAIPFLHKSLELSHPADSIVKKLYALLVQAHSRLGQRNEALAACRAGRARCPGDAELQYLEGQLLRDTGQLDAAIASFRRLVSNQETNRGVRGEDIDPRINTKKHEERKEINHGEHGEHGEDIDPRINTNGHEEEAIPLTTHDSPLTTQSLTNHDSPLTPSFGSVEVGFTGYLARNQLAHLYYGKGMHAEAEAEWRKAVEERPDFLPAWLGLGELYLAQGRLEDVDRVVESLAGKDHHPRIDTNGHEERKEINHGEHGEHGENGQGLPLTTHDSPLTPPLITHHSSRITASDSSAFSAPSAVHSNEALLLKARNLLARKEFESARAILEELGAGNPRWVYPKVILSHVLLQASRERERPENLVAAESVLRQIVDLDPSQAESWRNLAVLLRHQGKLAQAAGVCRSARVHCPQDVDLLLLQGIVLRENADWEDAETCLLAVISGHWPVPSQKTQQGRVEARHQLALLYGQTGRLQEAEAQWREVLAECPDHAAARQGLLDLSRQRGPRKEEVMAVT
jgi:glycosyltransferase involved in cell wall biosynthesis/Tfp pilus assembly protein PilF